MKLFALSFALLCSISYASETILDAIIKSDYQALTAQLSKTTLSTQEKEQYLDLATQVINTRSNWLIEPQVGSDCLIVMGSCFVARLALMTFPQQRRRILAHGLGSQEWAGLAISAGVASTFGYIALKKFLGIFHKQRTFFANAIRVKDALLKA